MEDPREALLRMGNTTSVADTPFDVIPAQPQKAKKSSRVVELQDSTELPGQTSDALADATQQDEEEGAAEAKTARKAAKKARKAAKKAEAEAAAAAMNVIPETPPAEEEEGQLQDANLEGLQNIESLLREHQQQQEQEQQEQQGDVDGEAALAAQVLASSALRGRLGADVEQQNGFAPGARVAMMGFPDHSNIDPMLRGGPDDTEEDLQNRLQELHAWQAAQQPDQPQQQQQQQMAEGVFTQGAPQVPIMVMQGGFGMFDPTQQNGNIADLAAAAEQQMTADLEHAEPKSKAKGGRKRKTDDDAAESGEKSKKRKRRSSQDDDEARAESSTTKKRGKKVKTSEDQSDEEDLSDSKLPTTGPFHKSEIARIEKIVSLFRDNNNMEQKDINDLVQNKSREKSEQRDMFWNDLYAALPNRQHVAIQRTTRRRYHNYTERGVWDKGADDRLKAAYAEHPQKWVAIGQKLSRMPEDCRDRWRNYLACGDAKRTEDWTQKEEMALQMIVHDLSNIVRRDAAANAKAKGLAFNSAAQDWDLQVNFNIVSEKMERKRSRLQCYQHWRIMQARDEREEQGLGRKAAAIAAANDGTGTTSSGAPKNEWRRRQAVENYSKMTLDDKIKIAHAVAGSETLEEAMIPWRLLKKQDPGSKWSTMDRKVAFGSIKKFVPKHDTLAETCAAIIKYLDEWKSTGQQPTMAESVGEEEQGLGGETTVMEADGEEDGGDAESGGRNNGKKPGPGHGPRDPSGKWKRKNKLSADMVVESEDEAEEDDDDDEQAEQEDGDQEMADGEDSVYRSALSVHGEREVDVDSITGEEVAKQLHQEEEEMMAMPFGQGGAAVAAMM